MVGMLLLVSLVLTLVGSKSPKAKELLAMYVSLLESLLIRV